MQQRPQAEKARRGNDKACAKSDDQRPGHRPFEQVLVLRPVGARSHDGKPVADTDAKAHQQLVDRPAGADGGQRGIAQHVAHDHGIHGIIQLLEQIGNQNGQHEQKKVLENRPVQQVCIPVEEVCFQGSRLGHRIPFFAQKGGRYTFFVCSGLFCGKTI